MAKLRILHERTFSGKPLNGFKIYHDPFGQKEICIELVFVDGEIQLLCVGSGKPELLSACVCYEPFLSHAETSNGSRPQQDNGR